MIVALLLLVSIISGQTYTATVYYNGGTYTIKQGVMDKTGAAWGQFQDTLNQTGWGILDARTGASYADNVQMYAIGYLEGFLTAPRVIQAFDNMIARKSPAPQLYNFFNQNIQWSRSQASSQSGVSALWRHVGVLFSQLDGLVAGYNANAQILSLPSLNSTQLFALSSEPDMSVIDYYLFPDTRPDWTTLSPNELDSIITGAFDRCSVLIKTLPDFSDLYFAHDTWASYADMNRIYKHYYFDLQDSSVKGKGLSTSSYPGVLFSIDDFYMTTGGLAVTETTNSIYNNSQYDLVTPQSLLTWVRIRTANALSNSAPEWANYTKQYWSGTYPNQWMIVDYKLFTPGQPLQPNTLWVMEEIPSMTQQRDQTPFLARGHWPSYNVAFYPDIYVASGYPAMIATQGPEHSYDLAPRAKIFRRDVCNVKDENSLRYIMRYNEWQTDPFSDMNSGRSIAARKDLYAANPSASGAIDTKYTTYKNFMNGQAYIINGPTNQDQPTFAWSTYPYPPVSHEGQPDVFNFNWLATSPTLFSF
jgi:hypothetical protein